jgi:UDP-N-acetylmuramate--alanine ligase
VAYLIPGQHVHLVGIGGIGMSAIARVLLQQGFQISGSDRAANAQTEALARDGATIHVGHDAAHVAGAELVIISSAVPPDHVEVAAAGAAGIPVYKRSDIIADVMSGHVSIAVAGTHGKTTTTAMCIHVLIETGQRPSYILGGVLRATGQNAGIDTGRAFVIEADEYDNMFHGLRPQVAVVTNIEWDHPDFFKTPHDLMRSFSHFVSLLTPDGLLISCADDTAAVIFAENRLVSGLPTVTYGINNPQAIWRGGNLRHNDGLLHFDVTREGRVMGTVALAVPGRHNVLNALAALAVADSQGVPFPYAAEALRSFAGTGRRFEVRGEAGGVIVVDDYAHHPTAIRVTLEAARQRYPGHQVWAVWQPHTYSRTQALLEEYAVAFGEADHVLVTDIYAAREQPIPGVTADEVVEAIQHPRKQHTPNLSDAVDVLDRGVTPPAVVLVMSAGDAPKIGAGLLERRQARLSGGA